MNHASAGPLFKRVSRPSNLSSTVADELSLAITSGRYAPGEHLPGMRQLADEFGVSCTVVREAVRSLVARGLVSVATGRRVRVVANRPTPVATAELLRLFVHTRHSGDIWQVHELRRTLEVATAELAAQRASSRDLQRLEDICCRFEEDIGSADAASACGLDFEFHRALMRAAGNDLLLMTLAIVCHPLSEAADDAETSTPDARRAAVTLHEHRMILRGIAERDVTVARQAMTMHLSAPDSCIPR